MKHLKAAEIAELATDELETYRDYLKRVEQHEAGASSELKRIRAALNKRYQAAHQAAAVDEFGLPELPPMEPWWPYASEEEMNEANRQLNEIWNVDDDDIWPR